MILFEIPSVRIKDSQEFKTHHGAVADLYGLEDMQQQFRGIAGHQKSTASRGGMVDIPGQIDS